MMATIVRVFLRFKDVKGFVNNLIQEKSYNFYFIFSIQYTFISTLSLQYIFVHQLY